MEEKGKFIKFLATDNLELEGFLKENTPSSSVLIHIHGLTGFFWSDTGFMVSEAVEEESINSFLINTRGKGIFNNGKFVYEDKKERTDQGTAYEMFEECLHDIKGAITFLKKRGYKNIYLSGHSTGCQKILYYLLNANVEEEIIAAMFLAPGDDLNIQKQILGEEKFYETLETAKENYKSKAINCFEGISILSAKRFYDMLNKNSIEGNLFNYSKELDHISDVKIPIFTAIGKDEEFATIPVESMLEKIKSQFSNKYSQGVIVAGDHGFKGGEKELKKEIKDWINSLQ